MDATTTDMQLIWLRSDLRQHDNTALAAAAARGPTVAVYLLSPQQWQEHDDAPCKVDFWLRNLHELSKSLGQLNIPLLIRTAAHWDQAPAELCKLCRQLNIKVVHVNEEYGLNESRRDAAVAEARRQEAITDMAEAMQGWLQLELAGQLLQWATEQYRERHQGPMLQRASAMFRTLTLGGFERLIVELDKDKPELLGERANGRRVEVSGLSDGTRDQLYLALRLAALELQHGQGAQVLPPIADDLFINFDDVRTAAGLQVLGELSRQRQVLFLTHHAHLVPLAQQVLGPQLNVIEL